MMTNRRPSSQSGDEFKDKRILVTGGTKGLGEAVVRRFQLGGALVATTARALHHSMTRLPISVCRRVLPPLPA